jgi:hypothetical protein
MRLRCHSRAVSEQTLPTRRLVPGRLDCGYFSAIYLALDAELDAAVRVQAPARGTTNPCL